MSWNWSCYYLACARLNFYTGLRFVSKFHIKENKNITLRNGELLAFLMQWRTWVVCDEDLCFFAYNVQPTYGESATICETDFYVNKTHMWSNCLFIIRDTHIPHSVSHPTHKHSHKHTLANDRIDEINSINSSRGLFAMCVCVFLCLCWSHVAWHVMSSSLASSICSISNVIKRWKILKWPLANNIPNQIEFRKQRIITTSDRRVYYIWIELKSRRKKMKSVDAKQYFSEIASQSAFASTGFFNTFFLFITILISELWGFWFFLLIFDSIRMGDRMCN